MPLIETKDVQNGEPVKLFYEEWGSGQPVVFIHGWPSSHEMWEYQTSELPKSGLRCIAYDRRGFGRSDKPWGPFDYDTLADDLKAVIDGLGLQDAVLVGFSMGGGEVARYFSRHGGAGVSKAVLLSAVTPYLLKTDDNPDGVDAGVFEGMAKAMKEDRIGFLDTFGKQFFGVNLISHPVSGPFLEWARRLCEAASPRATQECAAAFAGTDFRKDLPAIHVPTLIIHGDADKTVPIEASGRRTAAFMPGSEFMVYGGAPHGLFYTERERLNEDLIAFIRGAGNRQQEPLQTPAGNFPGL